MTKPPTLEQLRHHAEQLVSESLDRLDRDRIISGPPPSPRQLAALGEARRLLTEALRELHIADIREGVS